MSETTAGTERNQAADTTMAIIIAVSFGHMLNDIMQSLLPAIYPILKESYQLAFWQIGILTLTFQVTASLLQPFVGIYTDKRPLPFSLPIGMTSTLIGLLVLGYANSYPALLAGAALIGVGSSIFHPEASRVARMASGGKYGLAQSLFQVGGNFGQAVGPLLAAFIVVPRGQASVSWFSLGALLAIVLLWRVSVWYSRNLFRNTRKASHLGISLTRGRIAGALFILMMLTLSKNMYMASINSYYTFYTIEVFDVSVQTAQLLLFVFLGAQALGTIIGGPIGDRIGAKAVIWVSILGTLPFTLALPYVDLNWTIALSFIIGVVMASAFPAIVVFAQELIPGRVGLVAGIFFGFAFGFGGIAAALLGVVADSQGIRFVYQICSYLPLLGLLTIFLPNMRAAR